MASPPTSRCNSVRDNRRIVVSKGMDTEPSAVAAPIDATTPAMPCHDMVAPMHPGTLNGCMRAPRGALARPHTAQLPAANYPPNRMLDAPCHPVPFWHARCFTEGS